MDINVLVANLSEHYAEMKLHHWFSENYQQHIILDSYLEDYLEAYDTLTEYFIEYTNQDTLDVGQLTIKIDTGYKYVVIQSIMAIEKHKDFLQLLRNEYNSDSIASVIDDLIVLQKQTLYRLRKIKP